MKKVKYNKATEFSNIKEIINESIKKYKNNNAFIVKHKQEKDIIYENITYERFGDELNALGTALMNMGLKNKKIAVIGENSYEWMLVYLSVLNGVGTIVPLDKGLPETEIENSLKISECEVIFFSNKHAEMIQNIVEKHQTNLTNFICMDKIIDSFKNNNLLYIKNLIEKGKELVLDGDKSYINAKIDNDKTNILLFTSGTTSASKAVELSHRNIASNIYALTSAEKLYSTDVNIALLPFHHTFGSTGLIFFLSLGMTNVFCDGLRHIQENLKEYKVTTFVGVPLIIESMYKKIVTTIEKQGKTKKLKLGLLITKILMKFKIDIRRKVFKEIIDNLGGNIRFIISGASGIDKKVAEAFNNFGILTVQGYGLTETSPVLFAENEQCIKYGSVGLPMRNVDAKIDNPNEDGIGEIIVKGPNIMKGYYKNDNETKKVLKENWFYTGDLGYIDKDGYLFITGRKKNVIVMKNGKNVYPEEIEQLVSNLPYVSESMVFSKERSNEILLSVKIVYNKDYIYNKYSLENEEEIKEMIWEDIKNINKGLPNYKHIKNLIITDEPMIKTTTAKIKRYEEMKKEKV